MQYIVLQNRQHKSIFFKDWSINQVKSYMQKHTHRYICSDKNLNDNTYKECYGSRTCQNMTHLCVALWLKSVLFPQSIIKKL